MAKVTGKNAVYSFDSTIYACITSASADGTSNVVETECSTDGTGAATTNKTAGTPSWTVTASTLLEGAASTVPAAHAIGTAGALIYYPEGDRIGTARFIHGLRRRVSDHSVPTAPSAHMALDVTFACTGAPTIGVKALMAKVTGKNAVYKFGATTYACITKRVR